ncbi:hypothetical protein KAMAJI_01420 [Serratia phage vB_SmaM-Kamaji]|nr:hypothetical protein KAMAJI_01420 [Serratia phage vB_SmaM-Kamaji]
MKPKLHLLEWDEATKEMKEVPNGRYILKDQVDSFLGYMDSAATKYFQVSKKTPEGFTPIGAILPSGVRVMPYFPSAAEAMAWAKEMNYEYDAVIMTSTLIVSEVNPNGDPVNEAFNRS